MTKRPSGVHQSIYPFLVKEAFFDACEDDAVGALHSPIGLGLVDRSEHEFGSDASAEFLEWLRVKLLAIVYRELLRYPEPAYDVLPKKFLNCLGGDFYQGFSFDPFGEVLYGNHCIFVISLGSREGPTRSIPHSWRGQAGAISCNGSEGLLDFGPSFWQASHVLTTFFASFSADGQKKPCLKAFAARGLMPMWDP